MYVFEYILGIVLKHALQYYIARNFTSENVHKYHGWIANHENILHEHCTLVLYLYICGELIQIPFIIIVDNIPNNHQIKIRKFLKMLFDI